MTHEEGSDTDHELSVFFSPAYTAAGCEFDTTLKSGWIADSLSHRPIPGVHLLAPRPLAANELEAVHSPHYIEAIRTGRPRGLAESNGLAWDSELWTATCASTGGAVAAVLHAMRTGRNVGTLSSGLHHARAGSGAGFCTFNGLALAARAALDAGARRVLILDLDAHCGGGTTSLVRDWSAVVHTTSSSTSCWPRSAARVRPAILNPRPTPTIPMPHPGCQERPGCGRFVRAMRASLEY